MKDSVEKTNIVHRLGYYVSFDLECNSDRLRDDLSDLLEFKLKEAFASWSVLAKEECNCTISDIEWK
jgi:hypothetical protein